MRKLLNYTASAVVGFGLLGAHGVLAAEDEKSWEGFYAGAVVGASLGSTTPMEYAGVWDYGEYTMTGLSGTVGLQGGYNKRVGSAVVGVEIDFNYGGLDESQAFSTGYINEGSWTWFSTLRARGGLAVDNTLVYVTGGLAVVDTEYAFGDPATTSYVEDSGIKWGIAAGAGVEIGLGGALSMKGEYLYIGLPSEEIADFGGDTGSFTSSAHMLRVGVNYGF